MDAPTLELFRGDACRCQPVPVRGVGWVLRWAAVLTVLAASAAILLAFGCQLAAERALAGAAAAGLREVSLPRATSGSVEAVVRRQLAGRFDLHRATTIELLQNGAPIRGIIRPQSGDQFSLVLSAPADAALPHWLPILGWNTNASVRMRTDRRFRP